MNKSTLITAILVLSGASQVALATCEDIVAAATANPTAAFSAVGQADNGGYGLPMWIAAVDETGKVCAVVNSSGKSGSAVSSAAWLGSRVIAVQKATTANAFSFDGFSIGTSNLYGLTQPGGSLFGLQHSNPVDGSIAYQGNAEDFGSLNDPLVNKRVGGINVFGGGLALYKNGKKVGAVGVSGDTSCTDHAVAWKIRQGLGLDSVPGGFVSGYAPAPGFAVKGDEMIIGKGDVSNSYKQVSCAHNAIKNPTAGAATGVIIE